MNFRLKSTRLTLIALALVVNAALVFFAIPEISARLSPLYNQDRFIDGYDLLAANLVQGHGYRFYPETASTLMREPGYPVLLAGLLLVFGQSFVAVKLANFLLAVGTVWLMICIARKFSSHPALIVVPPLLFLFHPGILIAESRGGVEVLFTFLVTLFVLMLLRSLESRRGWDYVFTGGVLGLAVLVKSTPLLFPVFLLAYLLVLQRSWAGRIAVSRNVFILGIAMLVVLSPWMVRNFRLTHRLVPTASVFGVSAHAGQYICSHFAEDRPWFLLDRDAAQERSRLAREQGYQFKDGYYQMFYSTQDELAFSSFLTKRVVGGYEQNPWLCVKCMSYNLFNFWYAGKTWVSRSLNAVVQLPYLLAGIAGLVLSLRAGKMALAGPIALLVLYSAAVCLPILAQARYSVPMVPFLSIFAGVTALAIGQGRSGVTHSIPVVDSVQDSGPLPSLVAMPTPERQR